MKAPGLSERKARKRKNGPYKQKRTEITKPGIEQKRTAKHGRKEKLQENKNKNAKNSQKKQDLKQETHK